MISIDEKPDVIKKSVSNTDPGSDAIQNIMLSIK